MVFAFIGNFGTWEIILILFVALLVFGPGKLPEVAKTVGKTLGEIKKYTSGVQKEFQEAINIETNSNASQEPVKPAKKAEQPAPGSSGDEAITAQKAEGGQSAAANTAQTLAENQQDAVGIKGAEPKP